MAQRYGVIFDMDGVLVDSYDAHLESWQQSARAYGLEMRREDFERTFGKTSREIIRQLWPGRFSNDAVVEFDRNKEAAYREILREHFPEMPGASALIQKLHENDFALAIGSSGPVENVELALSQLEAGRLIDASVHGGLVKRGKPDPEVFLTAAARLGLAPSACAVVEDAVAGLQAAGNASMVRIALTGTTPRNKLEQCADLVVESLQELSPSIIRGLIDHANQ